MILFTPWRTTEVNVEVNAMPARIAPITISEPIVTRFPRNLPNRRRFGAGGGVQSGMFGLVSA